MPFHWTEQRRSIRCFLAALIVMRGFIAEHWNSMDDNEDVVSVQSANVIDLSVYRAQRKALTAAANSAPTWDQYQPLPFHGQTFFFGFWPSWVMAPIMLIGSYTPGAKG